MEFLQGHRRLVGAFFCVFLVAALAVSAGASRGVATSTITVSLGHPTELSTVFSKSSMIPPGSVVFKVTNNGSVAHGFKVCASPNGGTANSCVGKSVDLAGPGLSGTIKLTLTKGKYEYLSTADGQAVAGRKGLIGVGVVVPKTTTAIPKGAAGGGGGGGTTTTPKTSTAPSTSGAPDKPLAGMPVGNPANGASIFSSAGCAACHTLAAAGSTGTAGPNLNTAKPTLALIEFRVKNGGLDMPPFGSSLSNQQIADLATWVYQSTR
jgi:mono/diheme cytochrome c family protein